MWKLCAKIIPKVLNSGAKTCCWFPRLDGEWRGFQFLAKGDNWRWIINLRRRSGNKKAGWRVEARWFASQQKNAQESFKNQDHAHCFFFNIRGVVHHEFVSQVQTVNAAFYVEVLKCLRERVRCVWPKLWVEKNWILHHDNSPLHSALTVREFFAKNNMITMD
jgi:hypothetical protein